MAPDTKSRILDTALALFNERGSVSVTTNHVAEALKMSPGNLYYHFRNKAEIVRALFDRIMAEWARNYAMPEGEMPSPALLERMLAGNFEIQWRYRFFFRDLLSLLQADPDLAEAYRANRREGLANTHFLMGLFAQAGVIAPPGTVQASDDIAQALWLIGDFWLVFMDSGGHPIGPDQIDQGVRLFRRLLNPNQEGNSK